MPEDGQIDSGGALRNAIANAAKDGGAPSEKKGQEPFLLPKDLCFKGILHDRKKMFPPPFFRRWLLCKKRLRPTMTLYDLMEGR
jgi:hypothetical protein